MGPCTERLVVLDPERSRLSRGAGEIAFKEIVEMGNELPNCPSRCRNLLAILIMATSLHAYLHLLLACVNFYLVHTAASISTAAGRFLLSQLASKAVTTFAL